MSLFICMCGSVAFLSFLNNLYTFSSLLMLFCGCRGSANSAVNFDFLHTYIMTKLPLKEKASENVEIISAINIICPNI